jgi:hypothetical protein
MHKTIQFLALALRATPGTGDRYLSPPIRQGGRRREALLGLPREHLRTGGHWRGISRRDYLCSLIVAACWDTPISCSWSSPRSSSAPMCHASWWRDPPAQRERSWRTAMVRGRRRPLSGRPHGGARPAAAHSARRDPLRRAAYPVWPWVRSRQACRGGPIRHPALRNRSGQRS